MYVWHHTASYITCALTLHAMPHACMQSEHPRRRFARAGAYASGAAGSNDCPAGYVRIMSEAECRAAAVAKGKVQCDPGFVLTASTLPRGCMYGTGGNDCVMLNTDLNGAGFADANYQFFTLCAGAPPYVPHASQRPNAQHTRVRA
jgi:hypothetical protein